MPSARPRGVPIGVLGGLTPAAFLRRYWQKRPLLVRRAFPGFRDPLTPDELAGLACEPEVESRLVIERGGRRPWEVAPGPQRASRLRRLPRTHWTLLVQGADRFVPALADLVDSFSFLPRWRVDDVMVSIAAPQGSVGAHIDRYDVFLLQGQGRRRWQIDTSATDACRPGLDLSILRSFNASSEWVLAPGDMLYLPPGLAHYGVALDDCLTYSIGFRAPRISDLLLGCLERVARRLDPAWLYEDPDLQLQGEPGEIVSRAIEKVRGSLEDAWDDAVARRLPRLLGEILTEPTGPGPIPRARRLRPDQIRARLRSGGVLVREAASRASFVRRGAGADLFVDGRAYPLPASIAKAAAPLTRTRHVSPASLGSLLLQPIFVALVTDLVNSGSFHLERAGRARRAAAG